MRLLRCLVFVVLTAGLTVGIVDDAVAQEPPKPGPEHEVLMDDVGTWELEVTMSMPGLPSPIVSKGNEVIESACGGLFIESKSTGDFGGLPFEGRSLMGYDAFKKKYTGVWIDNFGTSFYQMEGTYDADTKTMTIELTGPDPVTGKPFTQKQVVQRIDDDTKKSESFMADPSGESKEPIKILTIVAKRVKSSQ